MSVDPSTDATEVNSLSSTLATVHITESRQAFVRQLVLGSVASCTAVTVTNPVEVLKIRMQLQGELHSLHTMQYTGIIQGLRDIAKSEGLLGAQRGLFPAYAYQAAMNGVRLGTYGVWKSAFSTITGINDKNFMLHLAAGASAGVCGAIVGNPFYLVKTRVQAVEFSYTNQSATIANRPPRSALKVAHLMMKQEGFKSFYKGVRIGALRTAIGSATQLATYEKTKQFLAKMHLPTNTLLSHVLSSAVSGACVVMAMNPLDVVYTRLVTQRTLTYTGIKDCFIKTVRSEGIRGLYKGASANYARLAPHSILTFVVLEKLNEWNSAFKLL